MGKRDIVNKLNYLFQNNEPLNSEIQIVYLLVEIRKILDRDNNNKYRLLRFYCDWSVHTAKDRITAEMKAIITDVYKGIVKQISSDRSEIASELIKFSFMKDLKFDVEAFLNEYGISQQLLEDLNWNVFVLLMISVLIDQPIRNPIPEISEFSFLNSDSGKIKGNICFTNKIGDREEFDFEL